MDTQVSGRPRMSTVVQTPRTRTSVAAVIPTLNVARLIRPTLDALRFCDEVIIVDMFSTDDTRAVCESYPNVRFFQRHDYIYGNFNFGVEKATAEWILRFDSDEVISPELRDSVIKVLEQPNVAFTHFDAESRLYISGMRLHGGYGNLWRTTLFRKGAGHYAVQGEHEGLTLSGPGGRLSGHYDHFSVPSLSSWLGKYNYYTDKDSERIPLRPPQPWWKVLWHAMNHFRGSYFGAGRLRHDGYLGFAVAVLAAFAQVLLELKVWERYERHRLSEAGLLPDHPNARPDSAQPSPATRKVS